MLRTLLTRDVIQWFPDVRDWHEAIEIACQPLINNGAIQPSYVEAIYESHEKFGPYYVVGSGIAIPHARPEQGVNRLALSLTLIKQGVRFGSAENDPVKLLFVFATTSNYSHIEVIAELAGLFDDQEKINRLMQAKNQDEAFSIIQGY
ncbi:MULTISPECIES: PTS sugar transporter subunit IIA [Xenorhabdus]|uniref:PTS sugar transporter subunit IIA n=1 Tax=Xenorhabdus TaxID=626 RepID=UPI001E51D646|nr:PTS sugar transporter subunit IIA [Xenorhabdus sp. PB30.3]MCC8380506.1 PTS sugar transporter subunit IIA [Xenorhabdus sp. PB30.3]